MLNHFRELVVILFFTAEPASTVPDHSDGRLHGGRREEQHVATRQAATEGLLPDAGVHDGGARERRGPRVS